MLSRLAKVLLVLTAFAPVLVTYAFVRWRRSMFLPWGLSSLIVALLLVLVCYLILREARSRLPVIPCQVGSTEIVAFVLSYLLPLVNVTHDSFDPVVLIFVLVFFLVIVWTTDSYHFNPLLSLLGFHFCEITDTTKVSYVLITRRNLRLARQTRRVVQISEYILLEAEGADG